MINFKSKKKKVEEVIDTLNDSSLHHMDGERISCLYCNKEIIKKDLSICEECYGNIISANKQNDQQSKKS